MDTVLAILGVILTIVIGIVGVHYTLKQQKTIQLTFLKNTCISLFKAIVKNLDDIEIKYQGNKIGENLILFKGTIYNNGNIDIDKSIVHKPLTLELPEHYSWIKYKIIDSSDGLDIQVNKDNNNLIFDWGLLKEGEFFTFDSLIEYQSDKNLENKDEVDLRKDLLDNITFSHRITNLKNIKKEKTIPRPMPFMGMLIMSIVFLSLVFGGFYFSVGQYLFPKYEIYQEVSINSTINIVRLEPISNNSIELKDSKDNIILETSIDDYIKKSNNKMIIKKKKVDYAALIVGGFFGLFYLIMWIVLIFSEMKERKLYKKLKAIADKYDSFELGERRRVGFSLFSLILK